MYPLLLVIGWITDKENALAVHSEMLLFYNGPQQT